jgi:hypothetical protein
MGSPAEIRPGPIDAKHRRTHERECQLMSLRTYVGVIGALALLSGLVFLSVFNPWVESPRVGPVQCQSSWNTDGASDKQKVDAEWAQLAGQMGREDVSLIPTLTDKCKAANAARRYWTIPLVVAGLILLVGTRVVRNPDGEPPVEPPADPASEHNR